MSEYLRSSYVLPSYSSYLSPSYTSLYNQPLSYASSPSLSYSYKGESYIERVPYERSFIDYEPVTVIDYVPVLKSYTDYFEIEHQTEYIPQSRFQTQIEYVPVEKVEEVIDYVPMRKSVVTSTSNLSPQLSYHPTTFQSGFSRSFIY